MGASPSLLVAALGGPILLLAGWLMGELARRLLRRRALVTGSTMTVVSVLGLSLGMGVVGLVVPGQRVWYPTALAGAFLVDLLVLALASGVIVSRRAKQSPPPIAEVVAQGESDRVEFKSTARINLHTGQRDDRMETVVAKTVSAFLNADGGALIIGIDDDGRPLGLDQDFATFKQPDQDRFELWLRDLLQARLGIAAAQQVRVDFAPVEPDGPIVCRLICPPGTHPVYLRGAKSTGPSEFWVRVGNSTRGLDLSDAVPYAHRRFGIRGPGLVAGLAGRRRAIASLAMRHAWGPAESDG
ncbi:MAG: helix-turn-helix domain-containing protein [Actinomycetales bacterium]